MEDESNYEFCRISTVKLRKTNLHQEVIREYASHGYRYVGWIPTQTSTFTNGSIDEIDLIFELIHPLRNQTD